MPTGDHIAQRSNRFSPLGNGVAKLRHESLIQGEVVKRE
jgi:hypothetical protein